MIRQAAARRPAAGTIFLTLVYLNAFVIGAIVMAFEMLGSRYLNPYFGSGIFTWASLIATILLALSVGYFLGGWLADRWPMAHVLGAVILVASLYLLTVPLFAGELFEMVFDLIEDVRFGSLIAAVSLMLFPVALLGVYSPFAIRLTLHATEHSGRVAGRIYGVSTLGSIVGTLVTTFYFIPLIGTAAITIWLGVIGIVSAATLFLASRLASRTLRGGVAAVVGLVGLTALLVVSPMDETAAAEPERFTAEQLLKMPDSIIEQIETAHNNIFIRKTGNLIRMSVRRYGTNYTESVKDLVDKHNLPLPYTRLMTVGLPFAERVDNMIMIGLGGGSTSSYLVRHVPGLTVDVVELDPGVIAAAHRYFGVEEGPRYRVHESDGRVFLMRNKKLYDLIMVDAFRGGDVPFHLLTKEFYRLIRKRLAPGAVAVFNVHSGTKLYLSTIATLKTVFPTVLGFAQGSISGNVIVVVSRDKAIQPQVVQQRAKERQKAYGFRYDLLQLLQRDIDLNRLQASEVLTDDFAPANLYKAIKAKNTEK